MNDTTQLDGAGDLPTPTLESSNAEEFAARWNAMSPDNREAFFQAIRMSDLEWLRWRETRAEVQAYVKTLEAQRDQAQARHIETFATLQAERASHASIGDHDHEFEDCCVICGKTWNEVNE